MADDIAPAASWPRVWRRLGIPVLVAGALAGPGATHGGIAHGAGLAVGAADKPVLEWRVPMPSDPDAPGLCDANGSPEGLTGAGFDADGSIVATALCTYSNVPPYPPSRTNAAIVDIASGTTVASAAPWYGAAVQVLEPVSRRIAAAWQTAEGRYRISVAPLPGSLYREQSWTPLGDASRTDALPIALATAADGAIVVHSTAGIARYGPAAQRSGPWEPRLPSGTKAAVGTLAVDAQGSVYVLGRGPGETVHKFAPDGQPIAGWAIDGLADASLIAGSAPTNQLAVLEVAAPDALRVRFFDAAGTTLRVVTPDVVLGARSVAGLALGPSGQIALYLRAPDDAVAAIWFEADGRERHRLAIEPRPDWLSERLIHVAAGAGRIVVQAPYPNAMHVLRDGGVPEASWPTAPTTDDIAVLDDGDVLIRRSIVLGDVHGRVERRAPDGSLRWQAPVGAPSSIGLASDGHRYFLVDRVTGDLVIGSVRDGTELGRLPMHALVDAHPLDVAMAPDGRVVVVTNPGAVLAWHPDTPLARETSFAVPLSFVGQDVRLSSPYRRDLRGARIAAGPNGTTAILGAWEGVVGIQGGRGWTVPWSLRIFDAQGREIWRLDQPDGYPMSKWQMEDIAVTPSGRLYVTLRNWNGSTGGHLVAFDLPALAPPASTPTPRPTAAHPPSTTGICTVAGTKRASPGEIWLGETVTVTLSVRVACPPPQPGTAADIVLIVDTSGSMAGVHERRAADAVRLLTDEIDLVPNRVGLITFDETASLRFGLTNDPLVVRNVPSSYGANGSTGIAASFRTAALHLRQAGRTGVGQAIVLISDGYSNIGENPVAVAESIRRSQGITFYTIGLEGDTAALIRMAGAPERHYAVFTRQHSLALAAALQQTTLASLDRTGIGLLADRMDGDVTLLPETVDRTPVTNTPTDLGWLFSRLPTSPVTMTYQVRPLRTGWVPTNEHAWFDYADADGVIRRFTYPIPEVLVKAPAGPPTPVPTATPSPTPTPTATSTTTPVPRPIYLPISLRENLCPPTERVADIALVIDTSQSMNDPAGPAAGRTKLALATDAVRAFLGRLALGGSDGGDASRGDRAAIIAFNEAATRLAPLTGDRAPLDAALGRLTTAPLTCIACGLELAIAELTPAARRPGATPVIVLLTDGRSNPRPIAESERLAAAAKAGGIVVFTIALGDDAEFEALARMASRPAYAYRAPTAEDLAAIYAAVAGAIPCPRSAYWGGR